MAEYAPGTIGTLAAYLLGPGPLAEVAKKHVVAPFEIFGPNRKSQAASDARHELAEYLKTRVGVRTGNCGTCKGGGKVTYEDRFIGCPDCKGRGRLRYARIFEDGLHEGWDPLPLHKLAELLGVKSHTTFVRRKPKHVQGRRSAP